MKENNTEKTLINLSNAVWESEKAYGFDFLIDFYNVERAQYTENHTKSLSNFDRDLINRIMKDYAFRLGLK